MADTVDAYAVIGYGSISGRRYVHIFYDVLEAEVSYNFHKTNPFCYRVELVKLVCVVMETIREDEGEGVRYDRQQERQEMEELEDEE